MEGQLRFRPLNDDHAIESVKFSVVLSAGILPNAILAVEQAHDLWRDSLPARSVADVGIDSNGRSGTAPGVFFAFMRPDGSPSWSMTVAVNRIDIECFLYSRWERVWASGLEYFVKVIEILSSSQPALEIGAVELTVKDVFVASGADYPLETLLNRSSRLPEFIFDAGQAWHANSGWFEIEAGKGRTLHNLNCDAAPQKDSTLVNISHYQQRGVRSKIGGQSDVQKTLDETMTILHKSNKRLVTDLLNRDMCTRIGLMGDK